MDAAIPHAEQPKVAPDAEYEPDVVLISVREGTTVEQLSQAIVEAGIQSVDPNGIETVTDGLMMARLVPGATIDDAIYELESKVDEAYGKGIVTVASASNQTDSATPPYVNFTGDYETIVSVMNLRNTDVNDPKNVTLSDASNYNVPGEIGKNISAPGTDIYSTLPSEYGMMSGTSMAAPHVTGVVGLMFAVNPMLSATQAKNLLYNSARDIGNAGWDETYGYGEVNASAAVRAATAGTIAGPEHLAVESEATYTLGSDYAGWSFSSSNPDVLAIDKDGTATAAAAGISIVSADNGNSSIAQRVTVLGPITGNNLVAKDGSASLSIVAPDECGDLAWEWSSSDESMATVTNSGVVYGKAVGPATITATLVSDPSVTLSHAITVYDARQGDVYVPVGDAVVLAPDTPLVPQTQKSAGSARTSKSQRSIRVAKSLQSVLAARSSAAWSDKETSPSPTCGASMCTGRSRATLTWRPDRARSSRLRASTTCHRSSKQAGRGLLAPARIARWQP